MKLLDTLPVDHPDWRLTNKLDASRIPGHIAIIMDGNGRWAKKRKAPRIFGHRAGIETVRRVSEACAQLGVRALTLYAFSVENWKRPRTEVEGLWKLLRHFLRREMATMMENNIQLKAIGRVHLLPGAVQDELGWAIEQTSTNTGMKLNLAINYGGRAEIVDAMNALIGQARERGVLDQIEITEESLSAALYTRDLSDPDLLIRTSGEMRISNFLLWQIAYTELYVTETLWPDFTRADLLQAILDFQSRDRRFGGLSKPLALEPDQTEIDLEQIEVPLH